LSRKNHEIESWSRVSMSQLSPATPAPAASESNASRLRRNVPDSKGVRCGSSARPISMSTADTTSTDSCVKARSGADKATKVSAVTSPTTPVSTSA
jgi:hypothetical protein